MTEEVEQLRKEVAQLRGELESLQDAFIVYTDHRATKKTEKELTHCDS
jgi:hypothetical protein